MASYAHGKQRRTKTRKEETEEAKNLVTMTLGDPRHSSLVRTLTKRANPCSQG